MIGDAQPPSTETEPEDTAFWVTCEADYKLAEITTVALLRPNNQGLVHLLGVVELLPSWIEKDPKTDRLPSDGGYPRSCRVSNQAGTLLLQRWHTDVRGGLSWYRACAAGEAVVPGRTRKGDPAPASRTALPPQSESPPWPFLVFEDDPFWGASPFWGARPGGARWHRMLPTAAFDVTAGWSASERHIAREWFERELFFDLLSRTVLQGSNHLRLPNPLFALRKQLTDHDRGLAFEFEPFTGQKIDELELVVWNGWTWGLSSVHRRPITSRRFVVPIPEGIERCGYAVVCPRRGVLDASPQSYFLRSVDLGLAIVTAERSVEVPPRKQGDSGYSYTASVAERLETMTVGPTPERRAEGRLAEDHAQEKQAESTVRWYDGDSMSAKAAVRDVISRAKSQLDLVDPYFGAIDLLEFVPAATIRNLPIRVLTSADFCKMRDSTGHEENGEALLRQLEHVRTADTRLSLEIRIMRGEKSPIHDRFLVVDDEVWVLGASLNEFGERGTMLYRLPARAPADRSPHAADIPKIFHDLWSDAQRVVDLSAFVESRRLARVSPARTPPPIAVPGRCERLHAQLRRLLGRAGRRVENTVDTESGAAVQSPSDAHPKDPTDA